LSSVPEKRERRRMKRKGWKKKGKADIREKTFYNHSHRFEKKKIQLVYRTLYVEERRVTLKARGCGFLGGKRLHGDFSLRGGLPPVPSPMRMGKKETAFRKKCNYSPFSTTLTPGGEKRAGEKNEKEGETNFNAGKSGPFQGVFNSRENQKGGKRGGRYSSPQGKILPGRFSKEVKKIDVFSATRGGVKGGTLKWRNAAIFTAKGRYTESSSKKKVGGVTKKDAASSQDTPKNTFAQEEEDRSDGTVGKGEKGIRREKGGVGTLSAKGLTF